MSEDEGSTIRDRGLTLRTLYCAIDQRVPGTRGGSVHVTAVADGLEQAGATLGADLLAFVDVGGDVLGTGTEPGLASPLCDAVMLAEPEPEQAWAHPAVVHHASGITAVQLGIDVDEALLRLRTHAFVSGRAVSHVAAEVVARRLRIEPWGDNG